MTIRYATIKDAKILAEIGAETFWDTYHRNPHLEWKDLKAHINSTFTFAKLEAELRREDIIYLIAENDMEKIGYARLLPKNSRNGILGKNPLEISRIYLRKKFWGKKLGSHLLEKCFEEAKKQNCEVIWLSVWQYNERAIKFYKKSGFSIVGEHIFDLAGTPETDYLMQKELKVKKAKS